MRTLATAGLLVAALLIPSAATAQYAEPSGYWVGNEEFCYMMFPDRDKAAAVQHERDLHLEAANAYNYEYARHIAITGEAPSKPKYVINMLPYDLATHVGNPPGSQKLFKKHIRKVKREVRGWNSAQSVRRTHCEMFLSQYQRGDEPLPVPEYLKPLFDG